MEHAVPELLFADSPSLVSDPTQAVGVSAVKALTIAEQQGQKIYLITQSNIAQLANVSQSATVMSDISNALAAGMEVAVSQAPISTTGFNGAGYIITDPGTGAGSYLIEDGSHGAKIAKGIISVVGIALLFFPASAVAGAAGLLALFAFIAVFVALYSVLLNATEILDTGGACALDLSERYMEFWIPLTVIAALPFGKGIQGLVLKLMGAMYGGDLFKGVGNSAACHP